MTSLRKMKQRQVYRPLSVIKLPDNSELSRVFEGLTTFEREAIVARVLRIAKRTFKGVS